MPGENVPELVEQARREVDQIRELIDEVLFLAELESGTRVVSLGAEPVLPVLREVVAELEEQAARAGVALRVEGDESATAEVRPRMLRVVARNLAENAVRYAGPGTNATLSVEREDGGVVLGSSTTASASTRPTCRACSSASTVPTARAPRAAPASGSRS